MTLDSIDGARQAGPASGAQAAHSAQTSRGQAANALYGLRYSHLVAGASEESVLMWLMPPVEAAMFVLAVTLLVALAVATS